MITVKDLFEIVNAKSKGFDSYDPGEVSFVTNGDYENAILGYVTPQAKDRVFDKDGICLSSFCEATVQKPPFIARGNGGSGLVVLVPLDKMSQEELYFYASQINKLRWRFSFSRMLIQRRIEDLPLIRFDIAKSNLNIKRQMAELMPEDKPKKVLTENKNLIKKKVKDFCEVIKKSAIAQDNLNPGKTPYVTTTSYNNGVSGYFEVEPNFKGNCLSVALNGSVCEVFFQAEDFITGGDNAVVVLRDECIPELLIYIGAQIKNHKWRYNYYRKMSLGGLKELEIDLPYKEGELDIDYIKEIVKNSYGYKEMFSSLL